MRADVASSRAHARDSIREARQAAGLTLHALGALLGARDVTVYRWESGQCWPSPAMRAALSAVLGVELPE